MSEQIQLTSDFLKQCVNDPRGPVALHLVEFLEPVEGKGQPFFPPTFAKQNASSPYNIDRLQDGTKVALVDSVGSQANRMEPLFLREDLRELVPQIDIAYGDEKKDPRSAGRVSILEAGHRLGDAIVRCTAIANDAEEAFLAYEKGDALKIAKLAPTSLVFGAWDSRETGTKLPRVVQSTIRAWDVSELKRSAQYTPAIDYTRQGVISEKDSENDKSPVAQRGYAAVPAVDQHGGIVANGDIRRDVTINLVALRNLNSASQAALLREYVLGLSLVAAGEPQDRFLRSGCLLIPESSRPPTWTVVGRDGSRKSLLWSIESATQFAKSAALAFGVGQSHPDLKFDKKLADADTKKAKKK
jgi:CRISPR-associated protein Csb1